MSTRKVLRVSSGHYEDYREVLYYVPKGFSWLRVAAVIVRDRHKLKGGKSCISPEGLMERALLEAGCEPVPVHDTVCIDDLRIEFDERNRANYGHVLKFAERLKGDVRPCVKRVRRKVTRPLPCD